MYTYMFILAYIHVYVRVFICTMKRIIIISEQTLWHVHLDMIVVLLSRQNSVGMYIVSKDPVAFSTSIQG